MIAQVQSQRHQMRIIPQQIELLNLFFLNSMEMEQRIKNELEENPFLDMHEQEAGEAIDTKLSKGEVRDFESSEEYMYDDHPDYKSEYQNYFDSETAISFPLANVTGFKEDAKQQLHLLKITKKDREIAEYIIDMLSVRGLMDQPVDEVAEAMSLHFHRAVGTEMIRRVLVIVQSLDPVGIGAVSMTDCLLLQLSKMDTSKARVKSAITLLTDHYSDLIHRQFEKLHRKLKIDHDEMKEILALIGSLKFYPVNETHQHDPKQTIIPDFIVTNSGGSIRVNLYSGKAGNVFVNESLYRQLADNVGAKDRSARQYVKSKLNSALWFLNAVQTRESSMQHIIQSIVTLQEEYFITGDIKYLKPMVLRNISEKTGLDIATISRITSNKYVDTPFGLIYLKKLFSEGIADKKGEVVSSKVIQSVLVETIESENKKNPYTDEELVNLLSLKGYNIARRTVSKYRQQLHVPIVQIRAVWA